MVEVQKKMVFGYSGRARATLCGDRACRIALAMVPCETLRATLRGDCACQIALSLWPRVNLRMSSQSARDRLQGSGCKVVTLK